MIPSYPQIIPELDYSGKSQTSINKSSLKYVLLSTFFYKRIEKNNMIYQEKAFTKKKHFIPLFTMTKALAHYNDYLKEKNKKDLQLFKIIAKKLIGIMDKEGYMFGWKHENVLQLPDYPRKYKSYSALINSRGLGVLIRYYQLNKSKQLLEKIKGILHSFEVESSEGGVLKKDNKKKYYLEYSWGNKSPVVWNGFMSALIGLYDCYLFGPQEIQNLSKKLFDQGFITLKEDLEKIIYKGKFLDWIRYDDNKLFFADGSYIEIETRQLKYLYEKTEDIKIRKYFTKLVKLKKENKKKANLFEWFYFVYKKVIK